MSHDATNGESPIGELARFWANMPDTATDSMTAAGAKRLAQAFLDMTNERDEALEQYCHERDTPRSEIEPPQDWKDIFVQYEVDSQTDAWLYQQIVAHHERASRSATPPREPEFFAVGYADTKGNVFWEPGRKPIKEVMIYVAVKEKEYDGPR